VLVNNAAIAGPTARVEEINPQDRYHCITVCLTGQFNCVRLAVPHPRQSSNASIINLLSVAEKFGFALRSPYSAAKWGVIGFTKSLAIELGDAGLRVNAMLPGLVAGDRQRLVLEAKAQQLGTSHAEMEQRAFSFTSIKEYVTAQQLADRVLFLPTNAGQRSLVKQWRSMGTRAC
jgi:NAD(P)-dependent dehydrogenase (short-subunit alcohol dehydrogenase family)